MLREMETWAAAFVLGSWREGGMGFTAGGDCLFIILMRYCLSATQVSLLSLQENAGVVSYYNIQKVVHIIALEAKHKV